VRGRGLGELQGRPATGWPRWGWGVGDREGRGGWGRGLPVAEGKGGQPWGAFWGERSVGSSAWELGPDGRERSFSRQRGVLALTGQCRCPPVVLSGEVLLSTFLGWLQLF
jgi:hypothetical protein